MYSKTYVKTGVMALSQLVVLVYWIMSGNFGFATNDDTTMVALAGGGYGAPSELLINSHVLLGYVAKALFTMWPVINWLTVIYLTIGFVSIVAIDYVFSCEVRRAGDYFVNAVFVLCCYVMFITYFTFTTVGYLAGIGAVVVWFSSNKSNAKILTRKNIAAFLLMALAIMVRKHVAIALLLSILPLTIEYVIRFSNRRLLIGPAIIVGLYFGLGVINDYICTQSAEQSQFMEWGAARQRALDSPVIDYDKHREQFEKLGYSKSAYYAVYNAFYYSRDTFSAQSFRAMSEIPSLAERYNFDLVGAIHGIVQQYRFINYYTFSSWLLVVVALVVMARDKKNVRLCIIQYATSVAIAMLFYFIGRNPYRVVMPIHVVSVLIMLLHGPRDRYREFCVEFGGGKNINFNSQIVAFGVAIVVLVVNAFVIYRLEPNPLRDRSVGRVIKYLEDNNDQIFLAGGDPAVFSLDVNRNAFDFSGRTALWNLFGNWEIYSAPFFALARHYGVSDPNNIVVELVDNKRIKLITSQSLPLPRFVVDFVAEKTGKRVKERLVDVIPNTAFGDWYVYCIVSEVHE